MNAQQSAPPPEARSPRSLRQLAVLAWWSVESGLVGYLYAIALVPVAAMDRAGLAPLSPFAILMSLPVVILGESVLIYVRWRKRRWRGQLPLMAVLAALAILLTTRVDRTWGDELLRWRFESNRERYNQIADAVLQGKYPRGMLPEDSGLAYVVEPVTAQAQNGRIIGVSFVVVSHGFAGATHFARLSEPGVRANEGFGWWDHARVPLGGNWYMVFGE